MAVAGKVVEAGRLVVELAREVTASAVPVEIGGCQVAKGRKQKTVQVVAQLCRPLDRKRRRTLQQAVSKVQGMEKGGCQSGTYNSRGGQEYSGSGTVKRLNEEDSAHGGSGWQGECPQTGASGRYCC